MNTSILRGCVVLALLWLIPRVSGVPTLALTHQNNALIVISDNGPLDTDASLGRIAYTGYVGDYFGSFLGIATTIAPGTGVQPGQAITFMDFSGTYYRSTVTSSFAFIGWLIGTDIGPVAEDALGDFSYSASLLGSSSWYINPPNQTTIGTPLVGAELQGASPLSLMNVVHFSPSMTPVEFSSVGKIVYRGADGGSTLLLSAIALLTIIAGRQFLGRGRDSK